jgi:thiol:disulfide interchange protein
MRDMFLSPGRRRLAGASLFLLILLALALVAVPMWLIRPFAPQTPEGIAVAYAMRRWAPLATVAAVAAALLLTAALWRNARWWSRALVVLAFVPLLGAAWQSRQNIFETKLFAPLTETRSAPATEAAWVEENDRVLAIALNGDAAAYPVRQVSYHHIVHDVVGGVPVAVTY